MVLDSITSKLREIWCAIVKDERSYGCLPPHCAAAVNPEGSGRGEEKAALKEARAPGAEPADPGHERRDGG